LDNKYLCQEYSEIGIWAQLIQLEKERWIFQIE
jgi:hypothetical protein